MRVTIHVDPKHSHHLEYAELMAAGLLVHGIKAHIQKAFVPTDCNLAIVWGRHRRAKAVVDHQEKSHGSLLVMERGCFGDREDNTRIDLYEFGRGGLTTNQNSPDDRWDKHKDLMKPWKPGKDYVVVAGQMPGDSSLGSVDMRGLVYDLISQVREQKHKVVYRPHPLDMEHQRVPINLVPDRGDLAKILKKAKCVVTYNSTVAVDAVLAGIPVIALDDRSLAWPVAGHDLSYLESLKDLEEPDRLQWISNLSYGQWTKEEIANGKALANLLGFQEDAKEQTDQVNQDR